MTADYLNFFALKDHPFRLTPDTRYFFPSSKHTTVLEVLRYALNRGEGFMVVTGKPGIGKTMLLRILLKELDSSWETALIMAPTLEPRDLIQALLEDLTIPFAPHETKERLLKNFRDHLVKLVETGKKLLLIIDEAQNLPTGSLEELRLLSNLETEEKKLVHILLVGQPSLEDKLKHPALSQLIQRITIWERMETLSPEEVIAYIQFRMTKAGGTIIPFEKGAEKVLHRYSQSLPRLINKIMDRVLLIAATRFQRRITKAIINEALISLGPTIEEGPRLAYIGKIKLLWITTGLLAMIIIAFSIWWLTKKP